MSTTEGQSGGLGSEQSSQLEKQDAVDWDGPDDLANPLNWSQAKKNMHVIFVSVFTLYANLAATMFAPGAEQLISKFHIANSTIEAMTVSIYVLGFAVGPLILAPLSELYGRLVIYHICNLFYFGFTAGCAFSTNVSMFLVFRLGGRLWPCLPWDPSQVIGPVIGGFVTETIGWRWTFRIILIMSGIFSIISLIFLRETNAKVLLQRKAANVSEKSTTAAAPLDRESPGKMLRAAIIRPAKMLIFSPIVLLISLYSGTLFGVIFLLFTTLPTLFESQYHFDTGLAGLAYLGLGLGMIVGLVLFAILSDKLLGQKRGGTVNRPEERLILMKWFAPITPVGCFIYGWGAYYHVHWMVPIVGTFVIGLGALFIVMPAQVYLVDSFGAEAAASALAANLVVRSPFGAFLALAASPLYEKLGLGWGNSVLGFICLAFTPVPWLFYRYGEYLRTHFTITL
ncbi:Major facilitator superfamily domain general substrate transporter [Penicillium sp. CMV-2018d]|nr:Major facilitator superfamily domain general substrate transporter [Penicillium sp. CMV-2018d]